MCFYPIQIKTEDAFGILVNQSVPCGKCIECLKDSQNSWKIRLMEEARDHLYVYFFTLTYNDDSVPFTYMEDGTRVNHVSKIDIQLWLKRNRMRYVRQFNKEIDFKYFVTSEYGPNTGRPHYHGIIFTDISPTFITSMFRDWSDTYGFINFSEIKSGKKKVHDVAFHLSQIMLQNTASNLVSFAPRPNFVQTNLSRLELYRLRSGSCQKESVKVI